MVIVRRTSLYSRDGLDGGDVNVASRQTGPEREDADQQQPVVPAECPPRAGFRRSLLCKHLHLPPLTMMHLLTKRWQYCTFLGEMQASPYRPVVAIALKTRRAGWGQ